MRYTEARLTEVAQLLIDGIDEDAIDFRPTYDGSENEPVVLPGAFPNLLANGSQGIAVGMATNIPPHNLGEIIDACVALIDEPAMGIDDLIKIVPGPDFPTGGVILGRQGIRAAYHLGRGSIVMRGKVHFETVRKEREAIIVTEVPYQVNKASMVERIADLVREKKIDGIADLRDESDRDGYRVVVELRRDAERDVVLNQLYRFTPLQSSFGANVVALDGGRPLTMNLKDLLTAFLGFREEVVARRTKFQLNKARDRAHVLVGLAIAVANIDEVIRLIRSSADANAAREALMDRDWPARDVAALLLLIDDPRHRISATETYRLSLEQAKAILDLRLQRLTALGRDEIKDELDKLAAEIADYLDILRSRARILGIVKDELAAVRKDFATPRRTEIIDQEGEVEDEDLIQREDMVVTVSHLGYVKRVPLSTYRAQKRGGKGRAGMQTREEDFVARLFVASTHTPVLFFSSHGQVYKEKVWRLPLAAPQARGKALINILPLEQGENITTIMPLPEDESSWDKLDVMFATTRGTVRRNKLSDFTDVRPSGIIAMKLAEGEAIVDVQICMEKDDVLLTAAAGQCIRFPVSDVRVFSGRTSMGVRGIALEDGDKVISLSILRHVDVTAEERSAYLKRASAVRRGDNNGDEEAAEAEETNGNIELGEKRYVELSAAEQFVLTISEFGNGKRSSSYEYRASGRGGKGIVAMDIWDRKQNRIKDKIGRLVASFPVEESDQIMLVTDGGQLIRCPINGIRIAGRSTQGVIVFNTAEGERVVSVERISEEDDGA
jgi:DNA gyrase subunit A